MHPSGLSAPNPPPGRLRLRNNLASFASVPRSSRLSGTPPPSRQRVPLPVQPTTHAKKHRGSGGPRHGSLIAIFGALSRARTSTPAQWKIEREIERDRLEAATPLSTELVEARSPVQGRSRGSSAAEANQQRQPHHPHRIVKCHVLALALTLLLALCMRMKAALPLLRMFFQVWICAHVLPPLRVLIIEFIHRSRSSSSSRNSPGF